MDTITLSDGLARKLSPGLPTAIVLSDGLPRVVDANEGLAKSRSDKRDENSSMLILEDNRDRVLQ